MKTKYLLSILISTLLLTSCGYTEITREDYCSEVVLASDNKDVNKINAYKYEINFKADNDNDSIIINIFTTYDRDKGSFARTIDKTINGVKSLSTEYMISTDEKVIYEIDGEVSTFEKESDVGDSEYKEYSNAYLDYLFSNHVVDNNLSPWFSMLRGGYLTSKYVTAFKALKSNNDYLLNASMKVDEKDCEEVLGVKGELNFKYVDMKYDSSFFLLSGRREGDYPVNNKNIFGDLNGIYRSSLEYKGSVNYIK